MMKKADKLFASPLEQMVDFRFDERVVDVFPDMIQRSVPGYGTLISNVGILAARYAQENSHCYDLGSSLGAITLSMRQHIKAEHCQIIAVDNSATMIERAKKIIDADNNRVLVELRCEDINQTLIENASVVVMNFTLQFIAPALRDELIERIYQGMNPGGVLILSEKLVFDCARRQDFFTDAHHDFKRANGYSDLEVSQKRSALENVLIPETLAVHQQRLNKAGFTSSECWFQCFNFASLIAFK